MPDGAEVGKGSILVLRHQRGAGIDAVRGFLQGVVPRRWIGESWVSVDDDVTGVSTSHITVVELGSSRDVDLGSERIPEDGMTRKDGGDVVSTGIQRDVDP